MSMMKTVYALLTSKQDSPHVPNLLGYHPYVLQYYRNVSDKYPHSNEWYWRLRHRSNGKILLDGSEGYGKKFNVQRAIKKLPFDWEQIDVEEIE